MFAICILLAPCREQARACLSTGPHLAVSFLIFSMLAQGEAGRVADNRHNIARRHFEYITPPLKYPPPPVVTHPQGVGLGWVKASPGRPDPALRDWAGRLPAVRSQGLPDC